MIGGWSGLISMLNACLKGAQNFIAEYRLLVFCFGVLMYVFVLWKEIRGQKARIFVLYAAVMSAVALFPFTAVLLSVYQTRFYDYEWMWSLIPLEALLAWGIVVILHEEVLPRWNGRWVRVLGFGAAVVLLFLGGNLGKLQKPDEAVQLRYAEAAQILQYMKMQNMKDTCVVWGNRELLQYLRSHDGNVELFYGRDMWDAKAGAYDYDSYEPEVVSCYEWMEMVSSPFELYLLEIDQTSWRLQNALADDTALRTAVEQGVNMVILPSEIDRWMERKIGLTAEIVQTGVVSQKVGSYTLWILECEQGEE